jgi:hypothetical protein
MSENIKYIPLDIEAMNQAREFANNSCLECVGLDDKCLACQDLTDVRQTELAHEIVDEGNVQYKKQLSWLRDTPSGHDWISSQTRLERPFFNIYACDWIDAREEFLEPITKLEDRPYEPSDEAMLELITIGAKEKVCNWCNLTFNYRMLECPTCEMVEQATALEPAAKQLPNQENQLTKERI